MGHTENEMLPSFTNTIMLSADTSPKLTSVSSSCVRRVTEESSTASSL